MTSFFIVGIICQPTTKQQNLYLTTARSKPCFFAIREKQKTDVASSAERCSILLPEDTTSYFLI